MFEMWRFICNTFWAPMLYRIIVYKYVLVDAGTRFTCICGYLTGIITCHGQTVQAVFPWQNVSLSPQWVSKRMFTLGQHVIKHAPNWEYVYSTGLKREIFRSVLMTLESTLYHVVHIYFDYTQLFLIYDNLFYFHKDVGFFSYKTHRKGWMLCKLYIW